MESRWKKGWKVVLSRPKQDFLESVIMGYPFKMYYELNRITSQAEGLGPLFVFDTRKHAREFRKFLTRPGLRIYPCEYIPYLGSFPVIAPEGTLFALAVRLLKKG